MKIENPRVVAICTVGELFGGVERHVLGAMTALRALGIQPLLLLFHDGELAAQARRDGVEPVILPASNIKLPSTSRAIADILRTRDVRLVHAHGYKAMVFVAAARRLHRFCVVKTEHGLPEAMSGRPVSVLRDRSYHLLDRVATRATRAFVCYVTDELRRHYDRAQTGYGEIVVANGITAPDRRTLRRPQEFHEHRFNLIIIGRLDSVKGHEVAIGAIAHLGAAADVDLHIVGTGPREAALRDQAISAGVADRVHFLGFRRNIFDFMAFADALLMPSMHEGLPYTLLESMGLGLPIIASNVGGLKEVLEHEVNALLVQPRDVDGFAHAISRIRAEPDLRRRLGENARRLQETDYSLLAMMEKYLNVYRQCLGAMSVRS
ncbi:MAG TPA: glycosyltransferase family 4 protein [Burkholderiales bacterium]|nr:glycosyltransferase family 4 protein [Burkholderiales bacterium]